MFPLFVVTAPSLTLLDGYTVLHTHNVVLLKRPVRSGYDAHQVTVQLPMETHACNELTVPKCDVLIRTRQVII